MAPLMFWISFAFVFGHGFGQIDAESYTVSDEGVGQCESGACPKKGAAMLQKIATRHQAIPETMVLKGEDMKCTPGPGNKFMVGGAWNDLGTRHTLESCVLACAAQETCAFVTFMDKGNKGCTSFSGCGYTAGAKKYITYTNTAAAPSTPSPPATPEPTEPPDHALEAFEKYDADNDEHLDIDEFRDLHAESGMSKTLTLPPGLPFDGCAKPVEAYQPIAVPTFGCAATCASDPSPWIEKCNIQSGSCASCSECAGLVTKKRGFSGFALQPLEQKGIITCDDAKALGLEDSWYYDWNYIGSSQQKCWKQGKKLTSEFVPMISKCTQAKKVYERLESDQYAKEWKELGAKYLLGYNEPDGHVEGQTCGPDEAVEAWIWVQKIADYFDPPLILVSPTPISGKTPSNPNSGFHYGKSAWLDEFFEKCEAHAECIPEKIKYIAFHDYEGDFKTTDDNLQVRINNIPKNYGGRKIWLTEVSMACGTSGLCRNKKALSAANPKPITRSGYGWPANADDSISMDDQLAFLHEAIPYLESNPNIFRYAVFGTRYKPTSLHGYIDQLPYDSDSMEPTCLGQYYKDAPHGFAR